MTSTPESSGVAPRPLALLGAVAFVIMIFLSAFAFGHVRSVLLVEDNASSTASMILLNQDLFQWHILAWNGILIADVIVAWALYELLKPVNSSVSLLCCFFRLLYTGVHAATLVFLGLASVLIASPLPIPDGFSEALSLLFFQHGHLFGFQLALQFFGVHLILLGGLLWHYCPRVIAAVVAVAGIGYLLDGGATFVLQNNPALKDTIQSVFMGPMIAGELMLCAWLFAFGGKPNNLNEKKEQ